jgi:hypothetical protein
MIRLFDSSIDSANIVSLCWSYAMRCAVALRSIVEQRAAGGGDARRPQVQAAVYPQRLRQIDQTRRRFDTYFCVVFCFCFVFLLLVFDRAFAFVSQERKFGLRSTDNILELQTVQIRCSYGTAYLCTPEHNNTYKPEIKSQFIDGSFLQYVFFFFNYRFKVLVIRQSKVGHQSIEERSQIVIDDARGYTSQIIDILFTV